MNFFKVAILSFFAMVLTVNAASAASNNDVLTWGTEEVGTAWGTASFCINASTYETVKANSTDRYTYRFYAGESVYIYVKGDGDTDLDLYVYDENGNLIDSDTDIGDTCLCTFTPKWTGRFTIKVKNLGRVYNRYQIRFLQ